MNYASLTHLWLSAMYDVQTKGTHQDSRVGPTSELLAYRAVLTDINQNFVLQTARKADPAYAAAELLWYLSDTDDTTMLQYYAPSYKQFTEDGVHAHGAYGPRIMAALPSIIQLLKDHPDTRQAVIPIWNLDDLECAHEVNDNPCSVMLHFILRSGKLDCITYMRSNDVWLGMPYDIFCFTMIQRLVADSIRADYGRYTHLVGSLHIYDKNKLSEDQLFNPIINMVEPEPTWGSMHMSDVANAVEIERVNRLNGRPAYTPGSVLPLQDLANVCAKKVVLKQWPELYNAIRIWSPLLQTAWDIKYGGRDGHIQA